MHQQPAVRINDRVIEAPGAGLIQHVQVARFIDLALGFAERNHRADRKSAEHARFRRVGDPRVKFHLLQVNRLLQCVLAHLRRLAGRVRHAEILFPQLRAGDDVERPGLADQLLVPLFQLHRGRHQIPARRGQRKVRRHIHAAGGHRGGFDLKLSPHRRVAGRRHNVIVPPFNRKMQPVGVLAHVERLAGKIGDAHAHLQRFAREKLILVERHLGAHLRRHQRRQGKTAPDYARPKFHLGNVGENHSLASRKSIPA